MSLGCLLDVFWMSFGCLLDVFWVVWVSFGCLLGVFWVSFGLLDGYNKGGSSLIDRNRHVHIFSTFCCKNKSWKKHIKFGFFYTVFFPAHGFGNPQPYKIKNTGVNGPCLSYKIKNIAFEQRKTSGLWMFFGCFLDVFWVVWVSFGCFLGF